MNKLPVPSEAQEADVLVAWLRVRGYKFHHSPNETWSGPAAKMQGIRNKRQGTSPGFPDYTIIAGGHLIFVELKSKKGYPTATQKAWIEALNKVDNVQAFVARGADEAIAIIEKYAPRKVPVEAGSTF